MARLQGVHGLRLRHAAGVLKVGGGSPGASETRVSRTVLLQAEVGERAVGRRSKHGQQASCS